MTLHPSAASSPSRRHVRGGFTLVEMLVVLLILSVVGSLVVVAVIRAQKSAAVVRTRGDLQAIASALEQYKGDFGVYPAVLRTSGLRGAHALARALMGPGDDDGQAGPGFRTVKGGRIYKPYLSADSVRVRRDGPGWILLDHAEGPIEYYPLYFPYCNENSPGRVLTPLVGPVNASTNALYAYDHRDGALASGYAITQRTLQGFLGDDNDSNRIEASEKLRHAGPYIIGSPGANGAWINLDGKVGPVRRQALATCDDILNFEYK